MSRRRWLGWEPRRVTTYHYDTDGRVTHAVTVAEAEWDDIGRDEALALLEAEADTCPGCGLPLSETTDSDAEFGYWAPPPLRCHACTPVEHRRKEYADSPAPGALLFTAEPKGHDVRPVRDSRSQARPSVVETTHT